MLRIEPQIIGDSAIEWPGARVTSAAPQLFAIVALLVMNAGRPLTRRGIESLLFEDALGEAAAAHSLRQLLYRLRRLGLDVTDNAGLLALEDVEVADPLTHVVALSPEERAALSSADLQPFSGWHPRLPTAFLDWLDVQRLALMKRMASLLKADIETATAHGEWATAASIAQLLGAVRPDSHEWQLAHAEALCMLGRHWDAIDTVDSMLRNDACTHLHPEARALRGRMTKRSLSSQPPLRGRSAALAFLNDAWRQAQAGGARLASVIGPPGMGKTRLADEFTAIVRMKSGTVVTYRCDPTARPYPLALFAHILPELRKRRGSLGANPRHLAILERLRPTSDATASDSLLDNFTPEQIRSEMHEALADLIESVSEETPLLIVVDDAHLLDRHSAALLRGMVSAKNAARTLVLACMRPQAAAQSIVAPDERASSHLLAPLTMADSRALLRDLTQHLKWDAAHFEQCVDQAAGIPFYLCALSRKDPMPGAPVSTSIDISSLGASSYYSLDTDARTLLEACLLLGPLTTLDRASRLAGLADFQLLQSLRALEERGLVTMQEQQLRGPHALLQEVMRDLAPSSVVAVLNRRLARMLTTECEERNYDVALGLAAVDAWLAIGEGPAALDLLRRCAFRIEAMGEPGEASELLTQVLSKNITPTDRLAVLADVVRLGRAGGLLSLVTSSLRDSRALAVQLDRPVQEVQELELQIIEAQLLENSNFPNAVPALSAVATDETFAESTRCRATMHMLVAADMALDQTAAIDAMHHIAAFANSDSDNSLGAQLVFNTVFGSVARAYEIAAALLLRHPEPTLDEGGARSRRLAAFAYWRLLMLPAARNVCNANYSYFDSRGDRSQAMTAASLLTEIAISEGDFREARRWLSESRRQLRDLEALQLAPRSGYASSVAMLAILDHDYSEAERLMDVSDRTEYVLSSARYQAISCALRLRVQVMRGDTLDGSLVQTLTDLYERGKSLGGMDTVAEMLWCAAIENYGPNVASTFLRRYLNEYRKELEPPEWLLRHTTAADDAWAESVWC